MNVSGDGTTGNWTNSDCDPVPESSGNPVTFQQPPAAPTCFLSATDVAIGACDDNGTEDPSDDFFTITATLTYTDGDGDVVIAGVAATPAPAPTNATAQDFTVTLPADGAAYNLVVTVGSNTDGDCETDFGVQTAPAACSFSCDVVSK